MYETDNFQGDLQRYRDEVVEEDNKCDEVNPKVEHTKIWNKVNSTKFKHTLINTVLRIYNSKILFHYLQNTVLSYDHGPRA